MSFIYEIRRQADGVDAQSQSSAGRRPQRPQLRGAAHASSPAIFSTRSRPLNSREENLRERIPLDEFDQDRTVVPESPGIVECRRERLRPAAVALIEPYAFHPAANVPLGQAPAVSGFRSTLQVRGRAPGRAFARLRLPVAFARMRVPGSFQIPAECFAGGGNLSRPKRIGECLCMRIAATTNGVRMSSFTQYFTTQQDLRHLGVAARSSARLISHGGAIECFSTMIVRTLELHLCAQRLRWAALFSGDIFLTCQGDGMEGPIAEGLTF